MADEKKILRQILLECRAQMPARRARELSLRVQRRLLAEAAYSRSACVVLYAAKDNEVATDLIFADAAAAGRRVFYPRVSGSAPAMSLVRVSDPAELEPGAWGLLEPSGTELARSADLERALICVPGVAFGPAGQRLGRGGGFYDRLLADLAPQTPTAGLAYSFQVLDRLPESPTDRRLGLIVTESAVHRNAAADAAFCRPADQGGIARCC